MKHLKYFGVGCLLCLVSGAIVYAVGAIIYYGFWDEVLMYAFLIFALYMGGRSYCMDREAKKKNLAK